MGPWYLRYKPAASARTQLTAAALMWTSVGIVMLIVGILWSRPDGPVLWAAFSLLAGVVGLIKGRWVLQKSAARIIQRIRARGDGHCLGGFISWQTWLMVFIMILLGRLLRHGLLPRPMVGFIYEAVGVALLIGAVTLWRSTSQESSCSRPDS